jgi:hypothetical protein
MISDNIHLLIVLLLFTKKIQIGSKQKHNVVALLLFCSYVVHNTYVLTYIMYIIIYLLVFE